MHSCTFLLWHVLPFRFCYRTIASGLYSIGSAGNGSWRHQVIDVNVCLLGSSTHLPRVCGALQGHYLTSLRFADQSIIISKYSASFSLKSASTSSRSSAHSPPKTSADSSPKTSANSSPKTSAHSSPKPSTPQSSPKNSPAHLSPSSSAHSSPGASPFHDSILFFSRCPSDLCLLSITFSLLTICFSSFTATFLFL